MDGVRRNPFTPMHWDRHEDIVFERGLLKFPEETPERWERIAAELPGRTAEEVSQHYEVLVEDVMNIDSGRVKIPSYVEEVWNSKVETTTTSQITSKKRVAPWTPDEHRLFLYGLEKYGKGDWKSISRYAVKTKTSIQVASHAQKYFIRQTSWRSQKRKRWSIHDINISDNFPQSNSRMNILDNFPNEQINRPLENFPNGVINSTMENFPNTAILENFPNNIPNLQN